MKLLRLGTIAALVLSPLAFVSPAQAATITVCASGCDHTTVQAAVTAAVPNDVIRVKAGTYNTFGVVIDKPLTIRGAGAGQTILDGGGSSVGSVPGIFRILPGAAAKGTGVIRLADMTLQNPSKNTTASQYFAISAGVKQATTGITSVELNGLDVHGTGDGTKRGYGFYGDGGAPIAGVDRQAPALSITNSTFSDHVNNGIGVDAWVGDVTISGNTVEEGIVGSSGVLVMNEYTPNRIANPVVLKNNTSTGRFAYIKNYVGTSYGGYADIQITGNTITGLASGSIAGCPSLGSDSDCGIYVSSNGAGGSMGDVLVNRNTIRGTGAAGNSAGVVVQGAVDRARIVDNDVTGTLAAVEVRSDGGQSPATVSALRNRLLANTYGVMNTGSTSVNARENWWGCVDGPTSASPYCSGVLNTGAGSVNTSTWIVPTASISSATVETGSTATVNAALDTLNTGETVSPLPRSLEDRPVAFTATRGSMDPAGTTLDASLHATSQYTAPGTAGPDAVTVTVDSAQRGASTVTGEPITLSVTVEQPDVTGLDPTITGTPQKGRVLTAHPGPYMPSDSTLSYQWNADGVPIAGATGPTLTLKKAQVGKRISVTITASHAGYDPQTETSAETDVVRGNVNRAMLTTDVASADRGDVIFIEGRGYTPGNTYRVSFDGRYATTVTADEFGEFSVPFTVPSSSHSGPVAIVATGADPALTITTITVTNG